MVSKKSKVHAFFKPLENKTEAQKQLQQREEKMSPFCLKKAELLTFEVDVKTSHNWF